jgi:hypothetical protein
VTVADVLGHEDATTTLAVYAHLFERKRTDEAKGRAGLGLRQPQTQLPFSLTRAFVKTLRIVTLGRGR